MVNHSRQTKYPKSKQRPKVTTIFHKTPKSCRRYQLKAENCNKLYHNPIVKCKIQASHICREVIQTDFCSSASKQQGTRLDLVV